MTIRPSNENDLEIIMAIYAHARAFMAANGNPNQWGPTNWPPEKLIRQDIVGGHSFVCEEAGQVLGTFYFNCGQNIEPTYNDITDGGWSGHDIYGVVHRIASAGTQKGVGSFCLNWAFEQCGNLRIDTHPDNTVMQNLLSKLGFKKAGIVHVAEDDNPRFAYEKIAG